MTKLKYSSSTAAIYFLGEVVIREARVSIASTDNYLEEYNLFVENVQLITMFIYSAALSVLIISVYLAIKSKY